MTSKLGDVGLLEPLEAISLEPRPVLNVKSIY